MKKRRIRKKTRKIKECSAESTQKKRKNGSPKGRDKKKRRFGLLEPIHCREITPERLRSGEEDYSNPERKDLNRPAWVNRGPLGIEAG